ncbi:MAG TPA: DUF3570 domain-containing protein [Kofleriaceae bacterium]|nr:DUF3570 domain-containing protein [Kofleriaceae bacterium]
MRLQLSRGARRSNALVLAGALLATTAHADGTLAVRGVYYKERATRVVQPMLDAMFDAGLHGTASGHFLVDAITSASASSGAVDAQPFTERRYEAGAGYAYELGRLTLGGELKYSTESDYVSRYLGVRGQLDFNQKNTVIGLGAGVGVDTVSAAAIQGPVMLTLRCSARDPAARDCGLDTYAVYASASQIVSKDLVVGASLDVATLRGYQSNPYRQAIVGNGLVGERHPTERTREAFAGSLRYYVAPSHTALIAAYRYYRDTWDVHAHTPEARVVQELGADLDVTLGYRYYTQDGAYFFRTRYPADDANLTQFVTDDVKLSSFTGHTFEAKLGVMGEQFALPGLWAGARFEGMFSYDIQNNRFGNAVIAHVALTLPFAY